MNAPKPKLPWLPVWLLRKQLRDRFQEELLGDLEEIHQQRIEQGYRWAYWQLWVDVFHLIYGFSPINMRRYHPGTMIRHYTVVAFRNIRRNKIYHGISMLSLGIGMAVALFLSQYVLFELSFDQFHADHPDTYRIIIKETGTEHQASYPDFSYQLGPTAKEQLPEVVHFVRKERCNRGATVSNAERQRVYRESDESILFVDPSFFKVFSYPVIRGNSASWFNDPFSIVITERAALKYFGSEDPIGKTLKIDGPPSPGNYTVTGVLQNPPKNSHMLFDFLIPMHNYLEFGWGGAVKKQGGWNGFHVITYLQLRNGVATDRVASELAALIHGHVDDDQIEVELQPVADIHLESGGLDDPGFMKRLGNKQNIYFLSIIGAFILVIAWANYINLHTANAMTRAREVGIRRSLGAFRKQLMAQFLFESLLTNFMAFMLACGLIYGFSDFLQNQFGLSLDQAMFHQPFFWIATLSIVLLGALLAGLYPAILLSSLPSLGTLTRTGSPTKTPFRNALVTFQLLASLLLIAGTYLLVRQTRHLKQQDLGLDLEQVLIVPGPQVGTRLPEKVEAFRTTVKSHQDIISVSGTLMAPGEYWILAYRRQGRSENETPYVRGFFTTIEFAQTFGLELVTGTLFRKGMVEEETVIINEKAVKSLGFDSPESALNGKLHIGSRLVTVVGVVKNFQWHSAADKTEPYVITLYEETTHPYLAIRINQKDINHPIAFIETAFEEHFPGNPFDYAFADDVFNRQYQTEVHFSKLLFTFSILAISMASAGLFAMVAFTATRRVKEIGIRKVLGATMVHLLFLLTREYARIISIVTTLAIPIIMYFGNEWLDQYAARIDFGLELILTPLLIMLLIVLATITRQTLVIASTNPAEVLRKE